MGHGEPTTQPEAGDPPLAWGVDETAQEARSDLWVDVGDASNEGLGIGHRTTELEVELGEHGVLSHREEEHDADVSMLAPDWGDFGDLGDGAVLVHHSADAPDRVAPPPQRLRRGSHELAPLVDAVWEPPPRPSSRACWVALSVVVLLLSSLVLDGVLWRALW